MTVIYETPRERVAQITLNQPGKLNAISPQMRKDLIDATTRASNDVNVRAVVISGAGRAFCAGADLSGGVEDINVEDTLNTEYGAFLSVIQTMPKPVISAINGPAAGIGMTLALTCDLRVMAEDAYLMSAFANIGLIPDGGLSYLLTREIGYARSYQLAIEAEKVDAGRALEWGLINRKAPAGQALATGLDWAETLAARAPLALAATKRTFRAAAQEGLRNAMAFEAMVQRDLINSEDCTEGVSALMAKRKPVFKGK